MKTNAAPHLSTNTIRYVFNYLMVITKILTFHVSSIQIDFYLVKGLFSYIKAVYFKTQSHFTLHSTSSKQL